MTEVVATTTISEFFVNNLVCKFTLNKTFTILSGIICFINNCRHVKRTGLLTSEEVLVLRNFIIIRVQSQYKNKKRNQEYIRTYKSGNEQIRHLPVMAVSKVITQYSNQTRTSREIDKRSPLAINNRRSEINNGQDKIRVLDSKTKGTCEKVENVADARDSILLIIVSMSVTTPNRLNY